MRSVWAWPGLVFLVALGCAVGPAVAPTASEKPGVVTTKSSKAKGSTTASPTTSPSGTPGPTATATPTPTPTATATPTPTPTATATPTRKATATAPLGAVDTPTPTPTATPTPKPTATPTPAPTGVPLSGLKVSTYIGAESTSVDGPRETARFVFPIGIAIDPAGNLYLADSGNHIRKVAPDGAVTSPTLALGNDGLLNSFDVAVDAAGTMYVAAGGPAGPPPYQSHIWKITAAGVKTMVAGGPEGDADGVGTAANFNRPYGITVAPDGTLFVADTNNHRIRKVTADGTVSTFAGSTKGYFDAIGTAARFDEPRDLAFGPDGALYVADYNNHRVRKILADGTVSTYFEADKVKASAPVAFRRILALAFGGNDLYMLISGQIWKRSAAGDVGPIAGTNGLKTDERTDGPAETSQIVSPRGLVVDGTGTVFFTDGPTVRKLAR